MRKQVVSDTVPVATVLVVDDNGIVLRSAVRVLRRRYRVEPFSSPEEALVRIRSGGIDAVVTDFHMPCMSGLELARRIRAHDPELPVVLMTALDSPEGAREAAAAGVFAYLAKPFDPDVLLVVVQAALAGVSASESGHRGQGKATRSAS